MLQLEHHVADSDLAGVPVGEVDGSRRNLSGKSKSVCRDGTGRNHSASRLATEGIGDLVGIGWDHDVESRVYPRKIVKPASQPLKLALPNEARERLINGIARAQIKEILGRENTPGPMLVDANEDLVLKVIHGHCRL